MTDLTPAQKIRAEAKQATRKALLEAGLMETIDRGGDLPSIDAIVARAGYTRGAFYFYFEDRDQFVAEMLDWVLNDILQALFLTTTADAVDLGEVVERFNATVAAGDWPDVHGNIRAAYLAVLRELRPETGLRARHSELMRGIIDHLEGLIRMGQNDGTLRDDVDARDVAGLLILSAIGSIMWSDTGIAVDNEALGKATITLLRRSD